MVYIEDTVRKHNDLVGCSRMNGSATPHLMGMKRSAVEKTGGKKNEESDFSNKSRNDPDLQ